MHSRTFIDTEHVNLSELEKKKNTFLIIFHPTQFLSCPQSVDKNASKKSVTEKIYSSFLSLMKDYREQLSFVVFPIVSIKIYHKKNVRLPILFVHHMCMSLLGIYI
jgi:hypothetical protein